MSKVKTTANIKIKILGLSKDDTKYTEIHVRPIAFLIDKNIKKFVYRKKMEKGFSVLAIPVKYIHKDSLPKIKVKNKTLEEINEFIIKDKKRWK